jgi:CRISPR-associated protein Csm3
MRKINQYIFRGTFKLLENARTGGGDSSLQTGGIDLVCLRDAMTDAPYFPGSSIKGKMRSALEKLNNRYSGERSNLPCDDGIIARVFGPHGNNKKFGPTRIRVHDARVIGEYTFGTKGSTAIDRQTGTALRGSLRTEEFVPPGVVFSLRIDLDEYDVDSDAVYTNAEGVEVKGIQAMIALVDHGLDELCNTGIGAGTSKGYGLLELGEVTIEKVKRKSRVKFSDPQAGASS